MQRGRKLRTLSYPDGHLENFFICTKPGSLLIFFAGSELAKSPFTDPVKGP